jgi:acyl carrier protein
MFANMTQDEVRSAVLEIIEFIAPDEDLTELKGDVRLRDQIDLDSMDFLDIIMELRKRYKVQVPEEDYMELSNLDGCVTYLTPLMKDM